MCSACLFKIQENYLDEINPKNDDAVLNDPTQQPPTMQKSRRQSARLQQMHDTATQPPVAACATDVLNNLNHLSAVLNQISSPALTNNYSNPSMPGAQILQNPTTPGNATSGNGTKGSGKKRNNKSNFQFPRKKR